MSSTGGENVERAAAPKAKTPPPPNDANAAPDRASAKDGSNGATSDENAPVTTEKPISEEDVSKKVDAETSADATKDTTASEEASGDTKDDKQAKKDDAAAAAAENVKAENDAANEKPPAKKRGRKPKKDKEAEANAENEEAAKRAKLTPASPASLATPVKPKRGRPSKKVLEERAAAAAAAAASSAAATGKDGDEAQQVDANNNEASADKPKKRKSSVGRKPKKDKEQEAGSGGEETESEPEKQPKKRAKLPTAKPAKEKKTPGRKKKSAKVEEEEESDSDDEAQREVVKRVEALDPEVKAKFGQIVWAKMTGYPYWPALITDPRHLPPKFQVTAMKDLETKYLVYFYNAKNFAATLFKNVEPWDDTKNNYREGYPVKDSKAPKRRAKLMEAIAEADREILLPMEERVDGLLKPIVKEPKPKKEAKSGGEPGTPEKRRGRPPGSKNVNKTAKQPTTRKSKQKTEAATEATEKNEPEEDTDEPTQGSQEAEDEEEEDPVAKSLSKEEIKAKIASKKMPSKKKVGADDGDSKSKSTGAAKKASGVPGKTVGKPASSAEDIDSKRKKEIELVVPRKSVKSADIREMTEEAAKKKLGGPKEKSKKDKGDYKVGDLGSFASKLTRLHANESSKNNDELIQMLNHLFSEKIVYRSDVERSGLAAIIAVLRKSSNPTVAQTASALRKHLMKIIEHDTSVDSQKSASKSTESKKSVKDEKKDDSGDAKKESAKPVKEVNGVSKPKSAEADAQTKIAEDKPKADAAKDASCNGEASAAPSKESTAESTLVKDENAKVGNAQKAEESDSPKESSDAKDENTKSASNASEEESSKADDAKPEMAETAVVEKSDDNDVDTGLDKNRQAFVDMLSNVLELSGSGHLKLAKEIEEFVFDRYKESNDDYMVQARMITFGLKGNKNLRDRLFSGSLHGLELVYADDKFFEATP